MTLIRSATLEDAVPVAALAAELAQSFPFSPAAFEAHYPQLVADDRTCLLVALDGDRVVGYVLAGRHLTFYANGPVAFVEEIFVVPQRRGTGLGRELMQAVQAWAAGCGCALVALATRRAAAFYQALGYRESASYLVKNL